MKKEDYFKRSQVQGLPNRCPILNHCVRRLFTVYLYGDHKESDPEVALKGYLPADFKEKAIGYFGEAPVWRAPQDRMHGYFNGMCPEVNLFDHEHQLPGMEGTASCGGTWDYEGKERVIHSQFRHFSECAEFSKHVYDNRPMGLGRAKKSTSRPRHIGISSKLRFEVFQRDKFTCQYCNRTKDDGIKLQVDHRIPLEQGGTDDFANLLTACEECNQGKSNKVIAPMS